MHFVKIIVSKFLQAIVLNLLESNVILDKIIFFFKFCKENIWKQLGMICEENLKVVKKTDSREKTFTRQEKKRQTVASKKVIKNG